MIEWQPIETAPKGEDDMLLLLTPSHDDDYAISIVIGFWGLVDTWSDELGSAWLNWWEGLDENDIWTACNPTHWMPLPPPPQD